MNKFLLIISICMTATAFSQKEQTVIISQDSVINKWIHAVVNIEGQFSSGKAQAQFQQQMSEGKITQQEYQRKYDSLAINTPLAAGTAIFLQYNQHHFLLTAKHVITDTANYNNFFWNIKLVENGSTFLNNDTLIKIDQNRNVEIGLGGEVSVLFGVENYYVAWADSNDLAIINIDKVPVGFAFLETLKKRGYVPISVNDIDTSFDVKKGENVTAIGFPRESVVGFHPYPRPFYAIHSAGISLPSVSTGYFLREVPNKNFFEASIFVYHGFSGGPVISDNKLIGIVSSGYFEPKVVPSKQQTMNVYLLNHSFFIKSSVILPLLKQAESLKGFGP